MARKAKELEGMDLVISDLFVETLDGLDFTQSWDSIKDIVLEQANACYDKHDALEEAPPIRAHHFNATDRRVYLAYDFVKKQRIADAARDMFERGSFEDPAKQEEKLKKLLKQAAELQKQLGVDMDLSSILAELQ